LPPRGHRIASDARFSASTLLAVWPEQKEKPLENAVKDAGLVLEAVARKIRRHKGEFCDRHIQDICLQIEIALDMISNPLRPCERPADRQLEDFLAKINIRGIEPPDTRSNAANLALYGLSLRHFMDFRRIGRSFDVARSPGA
jgi:hypothetical protein